MANTLGVFCNGAVGFIDWLDGLSTFIVQIRNLERRQGYVVINCPAVFRTAARGRLVGLQGDVVRHEDDMQLIALTFQYERVVPQVAIYWATINLGTLLRLEVRKREGDCFSFHDL